MKLRASMLAAFLILVASLQSAPAGARLQPVDEGPRRADFLAFRTNLQQVVVKRDTAALLRAVHPEIMIAFGDGGIDAFKAIHHPEDPKSDIWTELGRVLALGGTFDGPDQFIAPYVFSRWPDGFDGFGYIALVGQHVRIRSAPSLTAPPLATLSYSLLRLDREYSETAGWRAVVMPDDRKGYVSEALARSPIDYRAVFVRSDGRWRMTIFIAGD